MADYQINRFEWLKAVLQCASINANAKAVASALAVQFTSDETGKTNPKTTTLSEYLSTSLATVKRGISDLVAAGWLHRTEGRGNGNHTRYSLISPGKIVPFRGAKSSNPSEKKGANMTPFSGSKMSLQPQSDGSRMSFHRLKNEPSYIEQSLEQKSAPVDAFRNRTFTGNAYPGPKFIRNDDNSKLYAWGRWLKDQGYPPLESLPIVKETGKRNLKVFCLPWSEPPESGERCEEARVFFDYLLDWEGARHAAQ